MWRRDIATGAAVAIGIAVALVLLPVVAFLARIGWEAGA